MLLIFYPNIYYAIFTDRIDVFLDTGKHTFCHGVIETGLTIRDLFSIIPDRLPIITKRAGNLFALARSPNLQSIPLLRTLRDRVDRADS